MQFLGHIQRKEIRDRRHGQAIHRDHRDPDNQLPAEHGFLTF
jgi:hypothetical protein